MPDDAGKAAHGDDIMIWLEIEDRRSICWAKIVHEGQNWFAEPWMPHQELQPSRPARITAVSKSKNAAATQRQRSYSSSPYPVSIAPMIFSSF